MNIADYIKTEINRWPNWINLILIRCNVFGSLVYGRSYRHLLKTIDDVNPEQHLIEIVNFAIKNVAYYREKYGPLEIKSIEDFEQKIGFIDKDIVMANWDKFLVDDIDMSKCIVGTTGGTSGKPLKLVTPVNRYAHSLAFWHHELKWFGWNYDSRAVIRNHKLPKERDYMVNPILKEFIFDAFRINDVYALKILRVMEEHNVKYIHAYPSAAYQFLKLCYKQQLNLSFIKLCILTSEAVTVEQLYFIRNVLKIPIYYSYGHSEKLVMAGNCPQCDKYHIESSYGYCELIDKNKSVIKHEYNVLGEITGTTFINHYMPLIRYKTGDYASYSDDKCSAHESKMFNEIQGRWDKSMIYRADGTVTSITALNLHGELYECVDGIQYIQKGKGILIVLIIKNEKYSEEIEHDFYEHFKICMGDKSEVEIRYVDKLIFQPNGKFLPFIDMSMK